MGRLLNAFAETSRILGKIKKNTEEYRAIVKLLWVEDSQGIFTFFNCKRNMFCHVEPGRALAM